MDLLNPYRYRDDNLRRMGYKSFRIYLASPLWKSIRARVLAAAPICRCCKRKLATQVHHRAYDPATLAGTNLNSLTATCAGCHIKAEHPTERWQNQNDRFCRAGKRMMDGNLYNAEDDVRPVWAPYVVQWFPHGKKKRRPKKHEWTRSFAPIGKPRLRKRP